MPIVLGGPDPRRPRMAEMVTALAGGQQTLGAAVDAFLAQPRPATTARTYARTLERLARREPGPARPPRGGRGRHPGIPLPELERLWELRLPRARVQRRARQPVWPSDLAVSFARYAAARRSTSGTGSA